MREYRGFKIPEFEYDYNNSFKMKENQFARLNYGTSDRNDHSAVLSLYLSNIVNNGLKRKNITIRVPFVWNDFINLDIDKANEILIEKCKDKIDKSYQ